MYGYKGKGGRRVREREVSECFKWGYNYIIWEVHITTTGATRSNTLRASEVYHVQHIQ